MIPSGRIQNLTVFVEHFPPFLGSDRTIFELARRVADQGVRVHFIATQPLRYLVGGRPDDWPYKKNWSAPPPKVHPNITAEYLLVSKHMESMWRRWPPIALLLTIFLFTIYSLKPIIRHHSDLVVAAHATPICGIVAFLSAKLTFRRTLMGCPDWMTAYAAELIGSSMSSLGPVLLQLLETRLYKWSDRIVTVTECLKGILVSNGIPAEKIAVIPNGVDPDLFSPSVDSSEIKHKYKLENVCVVFFSGHLEEWAGLSALYDLAIRLDEEFPDSRLLLVGSGDSIVTLFERLVRKNLGHMLVHAGLHPHEDMPKFTAAADISLCIFPDNPVAHAASPLKLFEYMASGNAVVATALAGTREVLREDTGILVPPNDTDALCEAVIRLCKDPALRRQMGRNARLLAEEKFSWKSLAKRFVDECYHAIAVS